MPSASLAGEKDLLDSTSLIPLLLELVTVCFFFFFFLLSTSSLDEGEGELETF